MVALAPPFQAERPRRPSRGQGVRELHPGPAAQHRPRVHPRREADQRDHRNDHQQDGQAELPQRRLPGGPPDRHHHRRERRHDRGDPDQRAVRRAKRGDGEEEATEQQDRQRGRDVLHLLLPGHQRGERGEEAGVAGEAEQEPDQDLAGHPEDPGRDVDGAGAKGGGDADDPRQHELAEAEQADADHLAGQQLPRPSRLSSTSTRSAERNTASLSPASTAARAAASSAYRCTETVAPAARAACSSAGSTGDAPPTTPTSTSSRPR
jgi:hypothetical protein